MPVTPLMQAVENGEFRKAANLLPTSLFGDAPSINTQDDDGNALLHYIAKNKTTPQYLLKELSRYVTVINFSLRNKDDKKPLTIALETKNDKAIDFILKHMPSPPITLNTLHYAAIRYPEYREKLLARLCAPNKLSKNETELLILLFTRHLNEAVVIMHGIMSWLPNVPYSFENEHPKLQFLYSVLYFDENSALETIKKIHQHHPDVMDDAALMNGSLDAAREGERKILSTFLTTILNQQREQALPVQVPPQKTPEDDRDNALILAAPSVMQNNSMLEDISMNDETPEDDLPQTQNILIPQLHSIPMLSVEESASFSRAYQEAGEYVDDMMNTTSSTFLPGRERERIKRLKIEEQLDQSFVEFLGETFEKNTFN